MEINPDSLNAILQELILIRWLLIAIVIFALIIAFTFTVITRTLVVRIKKAEPKDRQTDIEYLLDSGMAAQAKLSTLEWLNQQPKHPQAHWLLAKACYALGELVETKKILLLLLQLSPHYEPTITPWLQRLEKEIKVSGPKIINDRPPQEPSSQ